MNTKKITFMAMLIALSIALVAMIRFPLIPTAAFLEYDPADVPILIATFAFGAKAGLLITVIASLIQGFTVSIQGGLYGILMHIIATGSFVIVAGLIYSKKKSKKSAILALLAGTLTMTVTMVGANLLITPLYLNVPIDVVVGMLATAIIPFNLIKAGLNSIITFVVYKGISKFIHEKLS